MGPSASNRSPLSRRSFLRTAALGPLSVGALAACGQPAAQNPGASPARAVVEITYDTWYQVVTDPIVPLFEKFEQEKRIKVRMDLSTGNRKMDRYTAWYVADTAPDVVNGDNFSWSKFYNSGVILDLGEYVKRDKINLQRDYALMGSEVWCGKTYAMPFDADPRAVFYNKSMLKKAGAPDPWDDLKGQWTLDDMLKIATMTTQDAGGDISRGQWGVLMDYRGMSEAMGMFVWTFGGTWADFQKMQYTLDSRESLEAHQYVEDWVKVKKVVFPHQLGSDLSKIGKGSAFSLGKTAMWVRAAASQSAIVKDSGGSFEWDVAPFPGRKKGQPGVTIVSGNPHTVSKSTKHAEASYEFAKWLAGDDVQGLWAKEKVVLPTLKRYQAEFTKDPKRHLNVYADAYKVPYGIHFRHDNLVKHYGDYSKAMTEVYEPSRGVSDALKEVNQRLNQEVQSGPCAPYKGMQVPIKP